MPVKSDARERMIHSAAVLFQEHGVRGTAFADILEHSGAPRGSVYYHFPNGKRQLAQETTEFAGEFIAAGIVRSLESDDPIAGIEEFGATWVKVLRDTDFSSGCPVAAGALAGDEAPEARVAAGKAFKRWEHLIASAFTGRGVSRDRARGTATLVVAAIEGAIILSRAQESTAPLKRVTAELTAVARQTLSDR